MTSLPLASTGFAPSNPRAPHRSPFIRGWATVQTWIARSRSRIALAELDEFMLKDIGLTRADVVMESSKSFWQP
jgi:uncharacterized protein YjiS (DUF1127 family)